jgi:hypothetical protein
MNRLVLVTLVIAEVGCAADGAEGFEILHNLAPGVAVNECKVQPGGEMLPHGIIEVSSPIGYVFTPELSSRIVVSDNTTTSQRTIALRGAKIELKDPATDTELGKYSSLFSGSLPPGGTVSTSFTIIPPAVLNGLTVTEAGGREVLAKITPFGALGGTGDTIDGVTFYYPITICDYRVGPCVITNFSFTENKFPACPFGPNAALGNPNGCNAFQDGAVNCCQTPGGPVVCPGSVGAAAP